jgi:glutamine cyclotransferase
VPHLNELEFIDGEIYANVWHQDRIARISPQTGEVLAWLDLTGLRPVPAPRHGEAVLNGIAYDPHGRRLFVTGKHWSELFEIRQVAK